MSVTCASCWFSKQRDPLTSGKHMLWCMVHHKVRARSAPRECEHFVKQPSEKEIWNLSLEEMMKLFEVEMADLEHSDSRATGAEVFPLVP